MLKNLKCSPLILSLLILVLTPLGILAEEGIDPGVIAGNNAWMLSSTALVLLMTIPGVALFYGGLSRKQNVLSTLMHVFAGTCVVTITWCVIGYSIAYSEGTPYFGGLGNFLFKGMTFNENPEGLPMGVDVTFQATFAIITTALIAGSFAERIKFSATLIFMAIWSVIVYAPIAHMVWGGGVLAEKGILDFAGGTVVHINCGIAGLVAAIVVGKRTGDSRTYAPHNLIYTIVGASLLWVGWFGFNAGSALAANEAAGNAMLVTQIATAAAALSWMFVEWIVKGKPTVVGLTGGAIAGLVAITPASGFVYPMGALIIGLVAGTACWFFSSFVKTAMGYDDSFDVFGIHGIGGIVGALLTGLFCVPILTGGVGPGMEQLGIQFYGILLTIGWCAIGTFVILKAIDMTIGLRVSNKVEKEGLDVNLHGEIVD
jgi:Amt family ammonium transporter